MADRKEADDTFRRKRVRTLKRLIVFAGLLALLVPVMLNVVLFTHIKTLTGQLQELGIRVYGLQEAVRQLEEKGRKEEALQDTGGGQDALQDKNTLSQDKETVSEQGKKWQTKPGIEKDLFETTRKVYLTFDDGPSVFTNDILDILDEYGVKATFFVVGKEDEKSKEALKRIVEEGHTLGVHSYSHKYDEVYASVEDFVADVTKLQEYLYQVTGEWSRVYRFPGGSSNKLGKMDIQDAIRYLNQENIEYFDWNITSRDASKIQLQADEIVENCTKDLKKYKNAIILMHDAAGKSTTVEALPRILEKISGMEDTVILPITDDTVPVWHVGTKEETED